MYQEKILVADSSETSRKTISGLLHKKGYKVYEATDSAGVIRICRSIYPDIVLIDINLWGKNVYETATIIEKDQLSTVIFITSNPDKLFIEQLKNMNIFAYISKPIQTEQLYHIVEFSLVNSMKIKSLRNKVEKLENQIKSRKIVDRAKGLLMHKHNISEDEAYKMLRKKSMDECKTIEKISEDIINLFG